MAELTVRESQPLDWLEAGGTRTRRFFGMVARQTVMSEALTFRVDGELVAIAGVYADQECWFKAGPACARHLLALMRQLRRTLDLGATLAPGQEVRAYIDPGSVAGPRLAAMLGFTEAGFTDTDIGPLQTWRRIL